MPKENSLVVKICNWITKYSIYTAIFLVPIFFIPWTSEILDFNKQALLIFLLFISLFSWMIKVLTLGKIELNISKIHVSIGILFLIYLFATIFSIYSYGSFWGWPQLTAESLLSLILMILFYSIVSNIFSKKEILISVIILCISALISQIFGILQILGSFTISPNFLKLVSFNTIGSIGSLGIFTATILPLIISLIIFVEKKWKILLFAQILLSIILLFLINYSIVWWAVGIGSAIILLFSILKRNIFDGRWISIPMFFFIVSLFFIYFSPQISGITQKINEIHLTQKASFEIAMKSLRERPIFGSGPGTFYYNFAKFKNPEILNSLFWSINFSQPNSKIFNDLITTGILGFLANIALAISSLFLGIKYILAKRSAKNESGQDKDQQKKYWILTLGIISAIAVQSASSFFYNINLVLIFVYFFLIAGLVVFIADDKKSYELKSSSFSTLIITFVFTLAFIFGTGIIILGGQRYLAELSYNKGIILLSKEDIDGGIKKIELAANLNSFSDLYFRQLSQAYLAKLQKEFNQNNQTLDNEKNKEMIQLLVANSVNASKISTDINPKNVINWINRGFIYQNLSGFLSNANEWAINSYETALQLDPNNPYVYMQEGIINFVFASNSQDKNSQNQFLNVAKEKLEKAVSLKGDYSNALYFLGLVYDSLGDKNKAIEIFTKIQQLNPENTEISKILSNLKAGLPALQQANLPPVENPPSEDNKTTKDKNQNESSAKDKKEENK